MWDEIFDAETKHRLYLEQKKSFSARAGEENFGGCLREKRGGEAGPRPRIQFKVIRPNQSDQEAVDSRYLLLASHL